MLIDKNDNLLQVKGITICLGKKKILNDVSFNLKIGGVTAILGENGAGKSTLLNFMMISSCNQKQSIDTKRNIKFTFVPQKNYLDPYDTVFGQFKFQSELEGINFKRENILNHDIYRSLNIDKILFKRINTLSEGQKRAVSLGLAFLKNPEFILLDEPTNALDIKIRNSFWNSVMDYKRKRNLSIFISTHHMWEIENFVDYILILKQGEIISDLTKEDFFNQINGSVITIDIPRIDDLQSKIMEEISEKLQALKIFYIGENNIKYINNNIYEFNYVFETLKQIIKNDTVANGKISINSPSVEDCYQYILERHG